MDFGLYLLERLGTWHQPWLDQLMLFFTHLGDGGLVWIVLILLLLAYRPTRRAGLTCAVSLLLSLLFCNALLKPLFQRPRPFTRAEFELLLPAPTDPSFPSGHSSSSFSVATGLTAKGWKTALPGYLLAGCIAFSRLYLQVHYPGDVLAGMGVGIGCGLLARWIVGKLALPAGMKASGDLKK